MKIFFKIKTTELDTNLNNFNVLNDIKNESVRYLIECYLKMNKKEVAYDLSNSIYVNESDQKVHFLKELSYSLIKFYSNDLVDAFDT
jgi:hypothetical protein